MFIFQKTVSKGSRFNQVYIPKEFNRQIEPGDVVEIRLIEKKIRLFYSNDRIILSLFKKRLIEDIFSFLLKKQINRVFICGSFIYKTTGYNDIDLVLITNNSKDIQSELVDEFNQNFHIIYFSLDELFQYYKKDPTIRTMLNHSVSNVPFDFPLETVIDTELIRDRLMLPEDLLKVKLPSKDFINNIKRLVTIEKFLNNELLDIIHINEIVDSLIPKCISEYPNKAELNKLREIIKYKLSIVKKKLR
jgi:hypothetical protein